MDKISAREDIKSPRNKKKNDPKPEVYNAEKQEGKLEKNLLSILRQIWPIKQKRRKAKGPKSSHNSENNGDEIFTDDKTKLLLKKFSAINSPVPIDLSGINDLGIKNKSAEKNCFHR